MSDRAGSNLSPSDEMGRELAEGPAAVESALAELAHSHADVAADLARARRIVLAGTGASLAVIRTVVPLWSARRPRGSGPLVVREASEAVLGAADGQAFEPTDLVIVVSQSGASPETLAAARLARATGAAVLGVTADPASPLASVASRTIPTPIATEGGAATKSALAALAVLGGIAGLLDPSPGPRRALAASLQGLVADDAWVPDVARPLGRARHLWCLGFGPSAGLATAASLLWHEKVRRPATASSPSGFRHGLIEASAVGDGVLIVDVGAPDDARAAYLDLLRSELAQVGVTFVELGAANGTPAPLATNAARESNADGLAPRMKLTGRTPIERSLEALLRIQQVARAAALDVGTYRDGFEYLRAIVLPWRPTG